MTAFLCLSDGMTDADDAAYQRITLRIPRELHDRLMNAGKSSSKSMNAEIISRLEASFSSIEERLAAIEFLIFDDDYGNRNLFEQIGKVDASATERLENYAYNIARGRR